MEPIADRKLQFAPYRRQARAIARLLEQECFRNASEFLRAAIDHYLEHLAAPTGSSDSTVHNDDIPDAVLQLLDDLYGDERSLDDPPVGL